MTVEVKRTFSEWIAELPFIKSWESWNEKYMQTDRKKPFSKFLNEELEKQMMQDVDFFLNKFHK